MRARKVLTSLAALRFPAGCLPLDPGAATPAAAAPGSGVVGASIEIRARLDELLRRWSDFAALTRGSVALVRPLAFLSRRVDFEPLVGQRSRVTVQLEHRGPLPDPASARRALEHHLLAFKAFVDESGPFLLSCGDAR